MSDALEKVRSGDLITADYMNTVIKAINAMENRLTNLENQISDNNQVLITQLIPSGSKDDPIREGDELKILGRNFGFSTGAQRVLFNSTRVDTYKPGTNDQQLIIDVPDFGIQNENGEAYNLSVSNGISTDTRSIVIYPRKQTFQGNVDVIWDASVDPNPSPNPIVRQKPAIVHYLLKSRATIAADVQVVPNITEFQSTFQVLDSTGAEIPKGTISLQPAEQKQFAVQIATIPDNAPDTFTLAVKTMVEGNAVGGLQKEFTIGQDVPPPDENITLNYSGFNPSGAIDGTTISLSSGVVGTMSLNAEFTQPDVQPPVVYNVSVAVSPSDSNWIAQLYQTPTQYSEDASDFVNNIASESPRFRVTPGTGASQSAKVIFKIQQEGETKFQSLEFPLNLVA